MTLQTISRLALGGALKLARLPIDTLLRFGGGGDAASGPRLAVDRVEASVRGAAGAVLGDPELQEDARRRHQAADEREHATNLQSRSDALDAEAEEAERKAEQRAEQQRRRAAKKAEERKEKARKQREQTKQGAAEVTAKRKQAAKRDAEAKEESAEQEAQEERAEVLEKKTEALKEKEKALTASDEAKRLREETAKAKEERKSDGAGAASGRSADGAA